MWKSRLLIAALMGITAAPCAAQDEEMLAAARRYPHENAIIWNHSEHVIFSFDDGVLRARSHVTEETLLLNEEAARYYNTGTIYHSSFHKLDKWQAASVVPDGKGYRTIKTTEAKTTRSEDESVFYDDASQTRITFGNLSKYTRTRLSYSMEHTDMHFLPGFYFQSGVPVYQSSFKVTVPKGVNLQYILKGQNQDWIKAEKEEGRNETTYNWSAVNVPKVKTYDDGPGAAYYIPHVLIYVASYKIKGREQEEKIFSRVEDLYRYYYPFVKTINSRPDDSLARIVAGIVKDAAGPREKAARIYRWVQQNIRYIAFEDGMGGFIPREAAAICSRRFGDCKDMSSLLVAMCRTAGLDAYFTWIGTRRKPYAYAEVPLPIVDDHMICTVKLGDEYIFMDGTDPVIPFGTSPAALQGKEALVGIDAQQFKVIKVPEQDYTSNRVSDSTHLSIDGDIMKGSVDITYSGYGAWRIAGILQYRNGNEMKDALQDLTRRGSNKYLQTKFSYSADKGPDKDMSLHSEFTLGDYARNIDNEWYINLNLQRTYEDEHADMAERKIPIVFNYKNKLRQVVVLDIPPGYKASYVPPDKEEKIPGLWCYKLSYQQMPRQVKLIKEYELYTLNITPAQFKDHNRLVEDLKTEYKESIVLSKTGSK